MEKSQAGIGGKAQERSKDLIQSIQDLCLSRLGMQAGTVVHRENRCGCSPMNGWEILRQDKYAYRLLFSIPFIWNI